MAATVFATVGTTQFEGLATVLLSDEVAEVPGGQQLWHQLLDLRKVHLW